MKSLVFIASLLLFSCTKGQEDEVYSVITTLLDRIESENPINIINETNSIWDNNLEIDICLLENLSLLQNQNQSTSKEQMISSLLKQQDIEFMCLQNELVLVLDSNRLPKNVKLISMKHLMDKKLDYSRAAYYQFSTPMFDSKYRYALIYFDEYCGPECGGGGQYFLKKKDVKW
jgi:hypothetical protein